MDRAEHNRNTNDTYFCKAFLYFTRREDFGKLLWRMVNGISNSCYRPYGCSNAGKNRSFCDWKANGLIKLK